MYFLRFTKLSLIFRGSTIIKRVLLGLSGSGGFAFLGHHRPASPTTHDLVPFSVPFLGCLSMSCKVENRYDTVLDMYFVISYQSVYCNLCNYTFFINLLDTHWLHNDLGP